MSLLSVAILSLSISADAFAASLSKGLSQSTHNARFYIKTGVIFSVFEMSFLALGWGLGVTANQFITSVDHWIAFVLLSGLGLKMIFTVNKVRKKGQQAVSLQDLGLTAFGTSIDSIAMGISTAFLKINIILFIAVTGVITFLMSLFGIALSNKMKRGTGAIAEILGGICLLGIGIHILLSHLQL